MYSDFVSDLSGSSVYSPQLHYLLQHTIIITLTIRHCPMSYKIKTEMRQNNSGLTDQVNWYLQSHYGFWLTHKSAVDKSSLEKYGNVGGVPTMQYRSSGFKAWNKALGIIFTAMSILSTLLPTSIHNGGMHWLLLSPSKTGMIRYTICHSNHRSQWIRIRIRIVYCPNI